MKYRGLLFTCLSFAAIISVISFGDLSGERNRSSVIYGEAKLITPGTPGLSPRDLESRLQGDEYDVLDYTIDIFLTPDSAYVSGSVVMDYIAGASGVSSIQFNLDQPLLIDSIAAPVPIYEYTHQDDIVSVFLDSTISSGDTSTVTVYYRGVPPPPTDYGTLYFRSHSGNPMIYSISWPDNARSWWPCKDDIADKATATIIVTVSNDLVVASNGNLIGIVDNGDGTATTTWREMYPVTTYNICVAISNYEIFTHYFLYSPTDTMPLPFYVWPEDRGDAEEDWNQMVTMTVLYDSVFGEYPFILEKYGMAETSTAPFAAMEHQTITSWGNLYITGDHRWDEVVAHELAHSWWGNSVTPAEWPEIWLSEGFASWSEALWREYLGGLDAYLAYMQVLDTHDFSGPLYDPLDLLSSTVYNKGAWVVHMLRYVVGDSAFFEILPAYANREEFKYGHASTPEFRALCEEISGMQLGWFFDQWVYEEGRPNYLMDWEASDTSGTWEVSVTINQVQTEETIFQMPLELLFFSGADSVWEVVYDLTGYTEETFELPWEPENVRLDPRGWILKVLRMPLEITTEELDDGYVGAQYYGVMRATGGIGARTWSIEGGALPDGLEIGVDNGLISGVPAVADSFAFLVRVTDSGTPPNTDEIWLSILVHPASGIDPEDVGGMPKEFALQQNFPNPFNPQTLINFSVPPDESGAGTDVLLEIFDIRGRKIRTLIDDTLSPGRHSANWNGKTDRAERAASGAYIYILRSGDTAITKKMLLLR